MKKVFVGLFLTLSAFTWTAPAFAQEPGPATKELLGILERLTNWMLALLLVTAGVFIIYAAYLYLTAMGDAEKIKQANRVILYAVISIAIALLAYVLIAIISALVGPSGPG